MSEEQSETIVRLMENHETFMISLCYLLDLEYEISDEKDVLNKIIELKKSQNER